MSDIDNEEYVYSDEDMDEGTDNDEEVMVRVLSVLKREANAKTYSKHSKTNKSPAPATAVARASVTLQPAFFKKYADYVGMSPQDLQVEQNALTQQVSELTNLPEDQASVLLLSFRWNKEKLFEHLLQNEQQVLAQAGALQSRSPLGTLNPKLMGTQFFCQVMYEYVKYEDTLSMGCERAGEEEHRFSLQAWEMFLLTMVNEGSIQALLTRCQHDRCNCIVSPRVWRYVLQRGNAAAAAQQALEKYERYLSSNFVDANRQIKWCPAPNCGWAIKSNGSCRDVSCTHCRTAFCFKCGLDAHLPLSCKGLQTWQEKCTNESETANWFVANTKKCPQCTTHIEKNHGCNHMHCSFCKFEFCWLCLGKWSEHGQNTGGYYACNKYDPTTAGKKDTDVSNAKRELDKYIHYYTRFQAHDLAGRFAAKQREEAEKKMTQLQKSKAGAGNNNWIDVQFIMDTVEQLIECRRVLKYTYAYAYSMEDGPRKTLFEYNQGMLENNTEKLSELSEMKEDKADRTQTVNYTKVTAQFLKSLLDDVSREEIEGFNQ